MNNNYINLIEMHAIQYKTQLYYLPMQDTVIAEIIYGARKTKRCSVMRV